MCPRADQPQAELPPTAKRPNVSLLPRLMQLPSFPALLRSRKSPYHLLTTPRGNPGTSSDAPGLEGEYFSFIHFSKVNLEGFQMTSSCRYPSAHKVPQKTGAEEIQAMDNANQGRAFRYHDVTQRPPPCLPASHWRSCRTGSAF